VPSGDRDGHVTHGRGGGCESMNSA
jgi:hypothetical protein